MEVNIEKRIVKIGRSKGIIIPPIFLKLLDINNNDIVNLSLKDEKIIINKKK